MAAWCHHLRRTLPRCWCVPRAVLLRFHSAVNTQHHRRRHACRRQTVGPARRVWVGRGGGCGGCVACGVGARSAAHAFKKSALPTTVTATDGGRPTHTHLARAWPLHRGAETCTALAVWRWCCGRVEPVGIERRGSGCGAGQAAEENRFIDRKEAPAPTIHERLDCASVTHTHILETMQRGVGPPQHTNTSSHTGRGLFLLFPTPPFFLHSFTASQLRNRAPAQQLRGGVGSGLPGDHGACRSTNQPTNQPAPRRDARRSHSSRVGGVRR